MTPVKGRGASSTAARKIFDVMRAQIRDVFPDDDQEAWTWTGEDFVRHEIERPGDDYLVWLKEQYEPSNEFAQRMVRRMFTMWQEMEEQGFCANDLELYEHQKALFAWMALNIANGTHDQIANLLIRSPYGSGKSLTAGLAVRAFTEVQAELESEGIAANKLPTGVLLGLRKEHMLQNAVGQQYAVLQPPYTVERGDINVYWKNLQTMFGDDFAKHFKKPGGKTHPFYDLFTTDESDAEDTLPTPARVERLIGTMDATQQRSWAAMPAKRRGEIVRMLTMLAAGEVVLVPDIYNVPQPERPLPREEDEEDTEQRYRGDSAHALRESATYRVKATHKHLALDASTYTTKPDTMNPAQFCIAYGSMVTRHPENIRADIRDEVLRRARFLSVDEAGAYTPGSLADSMGELSGEWPLVLGFTGQDRGIEGWSQRSPVLSVQQMIRLKLMKPIAFMGLGDATNPPPVGTEEAWNAYKERMFSSEATAEALNLPQPHELDSVVIAPPKHLREYAHRIRKAHEEQGIPVKIWCFDPDARDSRWSIVVNGFNAPKEQGEPRRILVAPPSQMAEALHLHAECYDVLAPMNKFAIDQARGRLGHIRNNGSASQQAKARTYFRVQWLQGTTGEPYIREVAKMMGYALPDENATWQPLRCMIDAAAYHADARRKGLSEPEPIPDASKVQLRKRRMAAKQTWTPIKSTSPFVLEKERRRAEREAEKRRASYVPPKQTPDPAQERTVGGGLLTSRQTFVVQRGKVRTSVETTGEGRVSNLYEIVVQFGIHSYQASLQVKADNEFRAGKRGDALANAVIDEAVRLRGVADRRAGRTEEDYE
jgi:hypothetical protein